MKVVLLGSGTAIPVPDRGPAGVLLVDGPRSILVDSGSGTVGRMAKAGVVPAALERAFYTHFHPDHTADLVALLFAIRVGGRPGPPLVLHGPPGLAALVARIGAAWFPWLQPGEPPRYLVQELGPGRHAFPGLSVQAVKTDHTPDSQGYRFEFEGGPVVAVSGDTGPCDALVDLGRAADVLVLECSFPDEKAMAGHLTPSSCADVARRAAPRRLVLGHVYPELDAIGEAVRRPFEGLPVEVHLGRDLLTLEL